MRLENLSLLRARAARSLSTGREEDLEDRRGTVSGARPGQEGSPRALARAWDPWEGTPGAGPQGWARAPRSHPTHPLNCLGLAAWRGSTRAVSTAFTQSRGCHQGAEAGPPGHWVICQCCRHNGGGGAGTLLNTPLCTGGPTTDHDPTPRAEKQSQAGLGETLAGDPGPVTPGPQGRADRGGHVRPTWSRPV